MFTILLQIYIYITLTLSTENERIACDGIIFNDVYYNKEVLFNQLGRPYNMIMHKYSGTLFFSHTIHNGSHVDFLIGACTVNDRKCNVVYNVPGGYAIAYDGNNDDIYLGGHDGIYKYNFISKLAEFFAERGKSIWGIFVKKFFYYIEYPSQKLYVYQTDSFVKVSEASHIEIDNFFISKYNIIYFSNKTALYKVEKPYPDIIMLDDGLIVRQIVEDTYGDVYFVASDGIYKEDRPFRRVKKIADINQAFSLTFDENDNIIYSDVDSIYRLLPSRHSQLCYEAIKTVMELEKNSRNAVTG